MKRRMRRATSSTIAALAVLAGLIAIGLATRPAMAQGVHKITGPGPVSISDPGHYRVTADFTGYITIEASDVDLNLGGHTITVPANFLDGILVRGIATTNVRISNGTVHGVPFGLPFSPNG